MRILDERNCAVLWSWGQLERSELKGRFRTNLSELLNSVRNWMSSDRPVSPADLEALAQELQEAGDLLKDCMERCYDLTGELTRLAQMDESKRDELQKKLRELRDAIGKEVVLTQSSIAQLRGKPVVLAEIRGMKAIIRDGEDYWETPVTQVALAGGRREKTPAKAGAA